MGPQQIKTPVQSCSFPQPYQYLSSEFQPGKGPSLLTLEEATADAADWPWSLSQLPHPGMQQPLPKYVNMPGCLFSKGTAILSAICMYFKLTCSRQRSRFMNLITFTDSQNVSPGRSSGPHLAEECAESQGHVAGSKQNWQRPLVANLKSLGLCRTVGFHFLPSQYSVNQKMNFQPAEPHAALAISFKASLASKVALKVGV